MLPGVALVLVAVTVSVGQHFLSMRLMGPVSDSLHHLLLLVLNSLQQPIEQHSSGTRSTCNSQLLTCPCSKHSCALFCNHVHHRHEALTVSEQQAALQHHAALLCAE